MALTQNVLFISCLIILCSLSNETFLKKKNKTKISYIFGYCNEELECKVLGTACVGNYKCLMVGTKVGNACFDKCDEGLECVEGKCLPKDKSIKVLFVNKINKDFILNEKKVFFILV